LRTNRLTPGSSLSNTNRGAEAELVVEVVAVAVGELVVEVVEDRRRVACVSLAFMASFRMAFLRLRCSRRRTVRLAAGDENGVGRFTLMVVPFEPGYRWCPHPWQA